MPPAFFPRLVLCCLGSLCLAVSAKEALDSAAISPVYAPVLQESQAKVAAAARDLEELRARLDEIRTEQAGLDKRLRMLAERDGAAGRSPLLERLVEQAKLGSEVAALTDALATGADGAFTSLGGMLSQDRLADEQARLQTRLKQAAREVDEARRAVLAAHPEGKPLVERWEELEIQRIAAENEADVRQAHRDTVVRAQGNLQKRLLPPVESPDAPEENGLRIFLPPPPDYLARRARFQARLQPEALAATARDFLRTLSLDSPGLEAVAALAQAGRPVEALDAYRAFFFQRLLRDPVEAGPSSDGDAEGVEGDVSDVNATFSPPTAAEVRDALEGVVRERISLPGKTLSIEANLGQPGSIHWTFLSEAAAAEPTTGPHLLEFSRRLAISGATGAALLHSYALTGNREHLARWVEILDDWTLNWRRDAEVSRLPLRDYNLLYVYRLKEALLRLRNVARMRPEFARDLPAATLARWLTAMNEEYVCSAIRLGRSGLYNFRIMSLGGLIPLSLEMQEFHLHQWALREAWRQVDDNFIYKIRRDGANFEFANDGHENTDQALIHPMRRLQAWNASPDWTEPFWAEEFLDNFLSNTRYWVHNLKQDGFSYRLNARTQRARYQGDHPEYPVNLLAGEPEVRRRMWKVHGVGRPEDPPQIDSESMAFQGYSYLRSGWEPEDEFLYFQSIGQPILSGREDNTGFSLHGHGLPLLLSPAPTVDGRVQDIHHGLVRNPGGKAPFASYGKPDAVRTGRFHAGPRFDLTEGEHTGVYDLHRGDTFFDVFGSYGLETSRAKAQARAEKAGKPLVDEPIRDVRQSRQVLSVRGQSLYIVTDRVRSEREHTYTQYFTLYTPVRADRLADRLKLLMQAGVQPLLADATARRLATRNPGLPNLEMRHFSDFPLGYTVKEDKRPAAVLAGASDPAAVSRALSKRDRHHAESSGAIPYSQQVAVEWKGRGGQTLVTVVLPQGRTYAETPPARAADWAARANTPGATGFSGTLGDGGAIHYQAGLAPIPLQIGDISGTASALLLAGDAGVAQDARDLTFRGQPVDLPAPDFTFHIEADKLVVDEVIHRPIRPVVIEPAVNVFTETLPVTFRCETPGVELRYTLDGTRPTPSSPLYTEPVLLRDTTRVRVRAFRPGLKEDVWAQDGTHGTVVYSAVYRRESPAPALVAAVKPGLRVDYLEGVWTELMAQSLTLPAFSTTTSRRLPDASPRRTDGAFAVRHEGLVEIPADGVYTFHAPPEFIYPDIESGYDLRVFVDGREWIPAVRWQAHGAWSIALQKGLHALRVVFVDLRHRPHKVELMWGFPHPDFTWKGTVPELRLSGPGFGPRPLPGEWLFHAP